MKWFYLYVYHWHFFSECILPAEILLKFKTWTLQIALPNSLLNIARNSLSRFSFWTFLVAHYLLLRSPVHKTCSYLRMYTFTFNLLHTDVCICKFPKIPTIYNFSLNIFTRLSLKCAYLNNISIFNYCN